VHEDCHCLLRWEALSTFKLPRKLRHQIALKRWHLYTKIHGITAKNTKTNKPWPESATELYRPSDRRLSAKLVPAFADRACHVVSVTDPYGHVLGFLNQSRYFFFQVVPELYSRGWVDPLPDPLVLRNSGSAGNRSRTSGSVSNNSDH
jgi:hypothetical protein